MSALSIIGLLALSSLTLYVTVAAVGSSLAELGYTGRITVSWVLIAASVALWWMLIWLQPFTITWRT